MEPNKLIKDKNKLLMAIPVILGILFLYVFFIREDGNVPPGSDRQAASQAFLEPQSEMADKVNDKMEAYKQDKLEEQEKARILKESQVKGSDFYFELQNQQERYDRATLERIRRMQNDPYSEVMASLSKTTTDTGLRLSPTFRLLTTTSRRLAPKVAIP